MEDGAQSERGLLLADPSGANDATFSVVRIEADALVIATYCEKCQEDLDGPCYEHADARRIIFDKAPIPLAYSSLPDDLCLLNVQPLGKAMVLAKRKIEASTLFGPLIAPLVPLDELEEGPPRYTMWSEEAQELQAYDLSDDFLCNWIKLVRPSSNIKEAMWVRISSVVSSTWSLSETLFPQKNCWYMSDCPGVVPSPATSCQL
ncbi:hypothetical protein RvY_00431-2 [Ramazzottius varieornatus]|uniref:Uncharacterized protein n=1 Tax=Ramazzottius varieornatus TaxID=947166 RepID=A0A1D1UCS0_RAMVA|nr:hypothetical protein RvY_00431-2 [Ramazzottius varieornatus]